MVSKKPTDGFTLLEVLVALLILGVLSAGLMRLTNQSLNRSNYLMDKTIATVVASNTLTEISLSNEFPNLKTYPRTVSMSGKDWVVSIISAETPSKNLKKLEVSVKAAEVVNEQNGSIATLIGYVENN